MVGGSSMVSVWESDRDKLEKDSGRHKTLLFQWTKQFIKCALLDTQEY